MKKTLSTGILLGLLGIVAIAVYAFHPATRPTDVRPVITLGATLPLTGDLASLGESNKNALEMALADLPRDTKYQYRLVFEDDQFKPAVGASAVQKLISIDGANALISFGSPVGNAVSPIAEKANIPHINDFASDPHVATGVYNFVDYTPSYEDSRAFIAELKKRNIKSLVFFEQADNSRAAAIIESFKTDIRATDIAVLSTQSVVAGSRDFRSQISAVKSLKPDIYVLEVTTPELEILTKQLREAGITTPVTTMEAFEFSDQPQLFEGMWYVNGADPETWFLTKYQQTYGKMPKFGAANGYDSLNLLVRAFETAGDGKGIPSGALVAKQLSSIKGFDGALGKDLFVGNDHLIDSKAVIRQIKDGVPITISR